MRGEHHGREVLDAMMARVVMIAMMDYEIDDNEVVWYSCHLLRIVSEDVVFTCQILD